MASRGKFFRDALNLG